MYATYMATRTVALDEEAYEMLRRSKKSTESFSEAVKRLARPRQPLSEFAGIWSDLNAKERRELKRIYSALREGDQRRAEKVRLAWG